MLNHKALAKAVCQIVETVTGVTAFIGDPGVGAPDGTYCAVRVQAEEGFGQAMKSLEAAGQDFTDITKTQKVVTVSLNFYRDGAMAYAGALREANKRYPVRGILYLAQLGWQRLGPINNLTALLNGNMEERAQVNLYLYAEDTVEDTVNRARKVKFTTSDEDGHVLAQGEVNGLSS